MCSAFVKSFRVRADRDNRLFLQRISPVIRQDERRYRYVFSFDASLIISAVDKSAYPSQLGVVVLCDVQ